MGLPMGLLREESPKNRMNTGLFGSRSGEYGLKEIIQQTPRGICCKGLLAVVAGSLFDYRSCAAAWSSLRTRFFWSGYDSWKLGRFWLKQKLDFGTEKYIQKES